MLIDLDRVIPAPLATQLNADSIWGQTVRLEPSKRYLVSAESGKGKSTLLSYLFGLRKDYSGGISFDGRQIRTLDLNDWADLRSSKLAIVFQDLRLFDQLSARENILIKQEVFPHLKDDEMRKMAFHLDVENLLDKPVAKLSMGQQQRFALIRALVQPFEYLLLDEPFSHLDAMNQKKMEELITHYCQINKAGLILTSLGPKGGIEFDRELKV